MKQAWERLSLRIDALSLRERVMVFAAVLAGVVWLAYQLVLGPLFERQQALGEKITQQQNSIAAIESQIDARARGSTIDPDAANRQRLEELAAETDKLGADLRAMQQSLVLPQQVVPLLERMLRANGRLRLVSLRTLPVTGMAGSAPASAAPGHAAQELVYRHGVELTLEGSYGDMVDYLVALQALPVRVIWGKAQLDASAYPASRLTLAVYTLSLDPDWMKL